MVKPINESMLREKIDASGLKYGYVAKKMGVDYSTFFRKITGSSDFNRKDIVILRDLLMLKDVDIIEIFLPV